jgi:signal transduction histidine kinase
MTAVLEQRTAEGEQPRARLLLADADNDRRGELARLLGRLYQVRGVADGAAALHEVQASPPDLAILDVRLPGRHGLDLLKALRGAEATRLLPVILLSAPAEEDAALQGLDAGADDYLVEPFSERALLARVRARLATASLRKESASRLAEASTELESFSYAISHDLRTPLRAIDGFSRTLQAEYGSNLDGQGRRYLERIRAGTQRMAELIDDLISLSRITRATLKRERVDLGAIARRVLSGLATREPERMVEQAVANDLVAEGDARLSVVLLENLLGNAWKFSARQPQARIEVTSEWRDGGLVFLVRDNGAGFHMDYAKRLFEPFQRLHSASEFPGTGIGLASAHRIVTRHGGRIWAQAAPGQGATFYFTLGEPT